MALYADIIAIEAPASASPGESVRAVVNVKNISTGWLYMMVNGYVAYGTTQLYYETNYGYGGPQGVMPFIINFTMPSSAVLFHAWSWYWDGAKWVQGDYAYVNIALAGVEYAGTITGKWINKAPEGNRLPFGYGIDLHVAADNNSFEIGVKYKNLSGRTVYGGCRVIVRDPQNILRATPAVDWTGMANNEELSTQYNICKVDKAGVWYTHIDFLMNKDNPVIVTSYDGQLFVATEVLKEEFSEFKISSFSKA